MLVEVYGHTLEEKILRNLIKSEISGKDWLIKKMWGQTMGQMLLRQAKKPWLSRLLLLEFDAPTGSNL